MRTSCASTMPRQPAQLRRARLRGTRCCRGSTRRSRSRRARDPARRAAPIGSTVTPSRRAQRRPGFATAALAVGVHVDVAVRRATPRQQLEAVVGDARRRRRQRRHDRDERLAPRRGRGRGASTRSYAAAVRSATSRPSRRVGARTAQRATRAARVVGERALDRLGDRRARRSGSKHAAGHEQLGNGRDVRADGRRAARERFGDRQPEAFVERREHEEIGRLVQQAQHVVGDEARQEQPFVDPDAAREVPRGGCARGRRIAHTITSCHVSRTAGGQQRPRVEQPLEVLPVVHARPCTARTGRPSPGIAAAPRVAPAGARYRAGVKCDGRGRADDHDALGRDVQQVDRVGCASRRRSRARPRPRGAARGARGTGGAGPRSARYRSANSSGIRSYSVTTSGSVCAPPPRRATAAASGTSSSNGDMTCSKLGAVEVAPVAVHEAPARDERLDPARWREVGVQQQAVHE